jgi:hypothetical protein
VETRLGPQWHREAWSAGGSRRAVGPVGPNQSTQEALSAGAPEFTVSSSEVYSPRSAWKGNSANFAFTEFSEVRRQSLDSPLWWRVYTRTEHGDHRKHTDHRDSGAGMPRATGMIRALHPVSR